MGEYAENWANLQNLSLTGSRFKIQFGLPRRQLAQQRTLGERRVQGVRPQQHDGVSQQRQAPRQSQTIEEHLPQSELVFLNMTEQAQSRDALASTIAGLPGC